MKRSKLVKIVSICSVCTLLVGIGFNSTRKTPKVIFEQAAITDVNQLYLMSNTNDTAMIQKTSVTSNEDVANEIPAKVKIKDKKTKAEKNITNLRHTTQLLKDEINSAGNEVKTYSVTYFYKHKKDTDTKKIQSENTNVQNNNFVVSNLSVNNNMNKVVKLGSSSDDQPDPSGGVDAYGTITFTKEFLSYGTYLSLTKASGGWQIDDDNDSVSDEQVYTCDSGQLTNGDYSGKDDTFYPDNLSFNYSLSGYPYISISTGMYGYGLATKATVSCNDGSQDDVELSVGQNLQPSFF